MVLYCSCDEEPESTITIKPTFNYDSNLRQSNIFFDFNVYYTRAPENGEVEDISNVDTLQVFQTKEYDKEWLFSGDKDQIQAIVYQILDSIEAPCYLDIVQELTGMIVELKEFDATAALPKVERVEIMLDVVAVWFPGERDDDVQPTVAPASNEAIDNHLETVVVDKDIEPCMICLDKIGVGSSVAAARMPCMHVFHHMCAERWLRNSGVCPVCRHVFPM